MSADIRMVLDMVKERILLKMVKTSCRMERWKIRWIWNHNADEQGRYKNNKSSIHITVKKQFDEEFKK